jgi:hypothetical protein
MTSFVDTKNVNPSTYSGTAVVRVIQIAPPPIAVRPGNPEFSIYVSPQSWALVPAHAETGAREAINELIDEAHHQMVSVLHSGAAIPVTTPRTVTPVAPRITGKTVLISQRSNVQNGANSYSANMEVEFTHPTLSQSMQVDFPVRSKPSPFAADADAFQQAQDFLGQLWKSI